ncbi:hypothetical protein C8J57DRAFT_1384392 [Mycena rebaudengoi]|nr:hypothetical protein C8J57DRAFT_1384392 [Mycena rebaudengoi]
MSSELDDELLELVNGASDKEKPTRKRARDASSSSAAGKGKASSAKSKKRKLAADSDNEPESEEEDDPEDWYPLEGIYKDEEDRAKLLAMTEIEREEILSKRLDDKDAVRDRNMINQMRDQQLARVAASENDATTRTAKRKAKDEKKRVSSLPLALYGPSRAAQTRGNSPKNSHERSSSPMDMEMSDSDSEDGQISKIDQEDERLFGKPIPGLTSESDQPVDMEYLQQLALTRDMLAKHSTSPWFEELVTGCWVRYLIGQENNEAVYRICQIKSLATAVKPYKINDKLTDQVFELKHGKAEKIWQMDRTSNDNWQAKEFTRLQSTCQKEGVPLPTRKEIDERVAHMQKLLNQSVTEGDVTNMLARKRMLSQSGGTPGGGVVEKSRLTAQRTLAIRRQDYDEVAQIDVKIAKLAESAAPVDQREDVLARVNERNRKANMEAVRRAEVLEAERKRRERKTQRENGQQASVLDPSARLRTIPRLFESATPTSRPATPNPVTLGVATPKKGLSPSPTPKLNGGKTFEASIIDSIEVDLGDF